MPQPLQIAMENVTGSLGTALEHGEQVTPQERLEPLPVNVVVVALVAGLEVDREHVLRLVISFFDFREVAGELVGVLTGVGLIFDDYRELFVEHAEHVDALILRRDNDAGEIGNGSSMLLEERTDQSLSADM